MTLESTREEGDVDVPYQTFLVGVLVLCVWCVMCDVMFVLYLVLNKNIIYNNMVINI